MVELHVEGMTCNHCVNAVTRSVKAVDANAQVNVDLASGRVRVESAALPHDISAAIEDAGYTVSSAS